MDYVPLVEKQIDEGWRLASRLPEQGFEVTAACWIWASEDGQWYLYLASPIVDRQGGVKAYRRVQDAVRAMPQPSWLHPFDVKLIETSDPIARDLALYHERNPGRVPAWLPAGRLGNLSIEAAYVYPPVTTPKASATASRTA